MTVRKLDQQLAQLDVTAPDYGDKLSVLNAEKLAFQLSECQKE